MKIENWIQSNWTRKCGAFVLIIWSVIAIKLLFTLDEKGVSVLSNPLLLGSLMGTALSILSAMAVKSNADRRVDKNNRRDSNGGETEEK